MDDFFLVSGEKAWPEEPRRCTFVRRVGYGTRRDLMLVIVDPPVRGDAIGTAEFDQVVLATRVLGESLFPAVKWNSQVHCARIVGDAGSEGDVLPSGSLEVF